MSSFLIALSSSSERPRLDWSSLSSSYWFSPAYFDDSRSVTRLDWPVPPLIADLKVEFDFASIFEEVFLRLAADAFLPFNDFSLSESSSSF